jgi:hypothetical protein
MGMLEIIKKAGVGAVESTNPVAVVYGSVNQIDPLEVKVDQRFALPQDFLLVPEHLTEYKVNIGGQEVVIRKGFEAGDTLLLLRIQGGQKYLILDRLVST